MSEGSQEAVCCVDCCYFGYEAANIDNPHPELWCKKGHWDGCENASVLYEPVECTDYKEFKEGEK